jgi:hypothetical protein
MLSYLFDERDVFFEVDEDDRYNQKLIQVL